MFGLTGYYYPYYSNYNYSYNPFFNMGYSPYLSNYGYNPFRNYSSSYMSNCRCNNSFLGNSNMNNPYYEQGYISGRKQRILNIANQSSYTLYEIQTTLQELISSDELTRTQKKTLSKYLKKVSNLQQQFQNLVLQSQTASAVQAVDTVNNQIEALQYVMNMLLAEIEEELAVEVEAEEDPDGTVVDDEVVDAPEDPAEGTPATPATPATPVAELEEGTSEEYTEEEVAKIIAANGGEDQPFTLRKEVKSDVININSTIYSAIEGLGTDNDMLKNAINKIDKDNVLDVFDNWNESYYNNFESNDPLGLIETIYDDHFNDVLLGSATPYIRHILDVLMKKADDLAKINGDIVKQIVTPHKTTILCELNKASHWYSSPLLRWCDCDADEDKVAKEINTIVSILTIYEHKKQS